MSNHKRKRTKQAEHSFSPSMQWESMPWKPIASENLDLGDFDDAVFFGLEELDGNAYVLSKNSSGYSVKAKDSQTAVTSADEGAEFVDDSKFKEKKTKLTLKELRKANAKQQTEGEVSEQTETLPEETKKAKKAKKQKAVVPDEHISFGPPPADDVPGARHDAVEEESFPDEQWGSIQLHGLLAESLLFLGFQVPTPIQSQAIPVTLRGKQDIVGAAETGSGKTLAFCIPVLDYILRLRQSTGLHTLDTRRSRCPHALIIAPTRELALQITSVLKEVCNKIRAKQNKIIQVVAIVGGMAEQKQRRLLSAQSAFVDIVVGTPGRLCELAQDDAIVVFQDMAHLRYLIVDEADRIVEDGHYAELNRLFNRIRDHEKLRAQGLDPVIENTKKKVGTYDDDFLSAAKKADASKKSKKIRAEEDDNSEPDGGVSEEEDDDDDEISPELEAELAELTLPLFEKMPTEEEIAAARQLPPVCIDDVHDLFEENDAPIVKSSHTDTQTKVTSKAISPSARELQFARDSIKHRQTLLYSATAIQAQVEGSRKIGSKKDNKKRKRDDAGVELPEHLQQLLQLVAVKDAVHIVDVTGATITRKQQETKLTMTSTAASDKATAEKQSKKGKMEEDDANSAEIKAAKEYELEIAAAGPVALPKGLSQTEIRTPTEDKDIYAYYFLLKHPGRTLVFVNSIKTARRVDGLLRALGFNCRTIHAQLQQRQRLRALESYRQASNSILVATDVAARGLDIPHIDSVLHYDVARSPQVYVHRSGRTARAGASGVSVSLVSPEDTQHHSSICAAQSQTAFPLYKANLVSLPLLRARVKLAKKIFTQSFVMTQNTKQQSWLLDTAKQADLNMDEHLIEEVGDEDVRAQQSQKSKKQLERAKFELKSLLDEPVPGLEIQDKIIRSGPGGTFSLQRGSESQSSVGAILQNTVKGKANSKKGGGVMDISHLRRRGGLIVFAK